MGPMGIIDSLKERSESKMLVVCDKCRKTFFLHKFFDEFWKTERFCVDFEETGAPEMKPVDIDRAIKETKELAARETIRCALQAVRNLAASRERALTITKLEEALMWFDRGASQ